MSLAKMNLHSVLSVLNVILWFIKCIVFSCVKTVSVWCCSAELELVDIKFWGFTLCVVSNAAILNLHSIIAVIIDADEQVKT